MRSRSPSNGQVVLDWAARDPLRLTFDSSRARKIRSVAYDRSVPRRRGHRRHVHRPDPGRRSDGELTVGKVLTTPADPSQAVADVLADTLARGKTPADQVHNVIHGTTLVTNAIIERKGAQTALLTTQGFRDAYEIAREHRYDLYDLFLEMPEAARAAPSAAGSRRAHLADGRCPSAPERGCRGEAGRASCATRASKRSPSVFCTATPIPRTSNWSAPSSARSRQACACRSRRRSCPKSASTSARAPPSPTSTSRPLVETYLHELVRAPARAGHSAASCS